VTEQEGGPSRLDDEQLRYVLDLMDKRIEDLRRHFSDLRSADQLAVTVAYGGVSERMQGFPAQYATKPDMDGVKDALAKLEKDAVSREIYEERHQALQGLISDLDRNKMSQHEFDTFVVNYRIEIERAAESARAIAGALASGTAQRAGATATWKLQAALIATVATVIGILVVVGNWATGS
jgi:hypothetical protein